MAGSLDFNKKKSLPDVLLHVEPISVALTYRDTAVCFLGLNVDRTCLSYVNTNGGVCRMFWNLFHGTKMWTPDVFLLGSSPFNASPYTYMLACAFNVSLRRLFIRRLTRRCSSHPIDAFTVNIYSISRGGHGIAAEDSTVSTTSSMTNHSRKY